MIEVDTTLSILVVITFERMNVVYPLQNLFNVFNECTKFRLMCIFRFKI